MYISGDFARLRDGGNGVFEDELFLRTGLQENGKLIKTSDSPGQFRTVEKVDNYCRLLTPDCVQKGVLNILWCLFAV